MRTRDSDYICKRCGSDDIVAEVEMARHSELPGHIRERNGKPYFDEDDFGRGFDDYDVVAYTCECGASASSIDKLVIRRRAFDEMRLPCGRCDHASHEHPQIGRNTRDEFTRPPMPCTVEGCDCHDYYDTALGLEPSWDVPGQQVLAA